LSATALFMMDECVATPTAHNDDARLADNRALVEKIGGASDMC